MAAGCWGGCAAATTGVAGRAKLAVWGGAVVEAASLSFALSRSFLRI